MKSPITVAQLIERLSALDPNTLVMIECEDDYYSGPVDLDDLEMGEALLIAPHDSIDYEGGWESHIEGSSDPDHITERRPALLIRA